MAERSISPFRSNLLDGQRWLISGGGSGIGLATARAASALGARLLLCGRRPEPLDQARQQIGSGVWTEVCDIRDADSVAALADRAHSELGGIDVLINNAGGQFPSAAEHISAKGFAAVINNNLNGTFNVTQAIASALMIPARQGTIINVIANVFRGFPGMAHTGAARAGVDNLTKTLAIEWAQYNVRVNAIAPGIIATPALSRYPEAFIGGARSAIPQKRLGDVRDVVNALIYLGCTELSGYVTGETLYVDGGARLWGDLWQIPDRPDPNTAQ